MKTPHQVLGVSDTAKLSEVKEAFKRLSLLHHPDRVPASKRKAAEERFHSISTAYSEAVRQYGSNPSAGREPINMANIRSVRDARAAAGRKFVWLTPVAVPLILSFAFIGVITYHQVLRSAESTRHSRPYGLLGPTINVFLDDEENSSEKRNVKGTSVRAGSAHVRASSKDGSLSPEPSPDPA